MGTTLRDIAEHLDVSPGLVSRVLNNKPGAWASEATQKRILDTAREMNYRPSAVARALVTGRAMQVAMLLREGDHQPVVGADLRGLIQAAAAHSYRVVVMTSASNEPGARELDDLLADRVVDGVCLPARDLRPLHLDVLVKHPSPCVLVGELDAVGERALRGRAIHVDHDNYLYAHSSTQWLQSQGKKRIAWVRPTGPQDQPHSLELRRGYRDAMKAAGEKPAIEAARITDAEIVSLAGSGRYDAAIVRWLPTAMQWLRALRAADIGADRFTVLAHLAVGDAYFFQISGITEGFAYHCHSDADVGHTAGRALMQWITTGERGEDVILVPPHPPIWCEPRSA